MICDTPTQKLEPPAWQLNEARGSGPVVALGFATIGTEEQLVKLAAAVQSQGLVCGTEDAGDGQLQMLVFFGPNTSRNQAFAIYDRVSKGEFATTKTSLILVPAKEAHKG